jgi:phenylpropionate dioxygenase-like ring-hydroxylating dioxygenase large terminal subunit
MTSLSEAAASTSDDTCDFRHEIHRPAIEVAKVLRADPVAPVATTLLERSEAPLGTQPIPAARYFSREFAALERNHLWPRVWQYACWSYDIANPGDIHVYRIQKRSVLIVRQRDGSLKAFHNACLHRGRELCETNANQTELRCPYHFFTWKLDGELKWVPSKWDFPQIEQTLNRLPEIRVETWNGFVFVNFDADAMPLTQYLGKMVNQWKQWDFSNRYKGVHVRKRINCNWKAGMDAFIESFHAFASHPQVATTAADDCTQVDVWDDEPHFSRMITPVAIASPRLDPQPDADSIFATMCGDFLPQALGTDEGRIKPGESTRDAVARIARQAYATHFGVDMSKLSVSDLIDPVSYSVFPNFSPWPTLAFPIAYHFIPDKDDPEWCEFNLMMFFPFAGERPDSTPIVELGPGEPFEQVAAFSRGMGLIADQDGDQLPAVQRGMHNLVSGHLTMTKYQEARLRHYHRTLENYLGLAPGA